MKRLIFCMAAALLTAVPVQTTAQTDSKQLAGVNMNYGWDRLNIF